MSKVIVVDENDNPIDAKERKDLLSTDIRRISALWVTNSKGEALIARRSMAKDVNPGKWGSAAAGTVEEGETYDSNILKEAAEEIGLFGIKPVPAAKLKVSGQGRYFCQWYLLSLDRDAKDFKLQEEEVSEIKWISKEDLLRDVSMHPDDYTAGTRQWVQSLT